MEILRHKTKAPGNSTWFFLIKPGNSTYFFYPVGNSIFSTPSVFFCNSPLHFQGSWRKHVEIAGVSQKRSEISRSLQDKIPVEFPWALVLWFWHWNFQVTQFCRISRGGGPTWIFFWNSPFSSHLLYEPQLQSSQKNSV